jgi:hypothetical protein
MPPAVIVVALDFDDDFDNDNALPMPTKDWNDHRHHCHKLIVDYWLMLLSPPPSLLASLASRGKSKYMWYFCDMQQKYCCVSMTCNEKHLK